MTDIEPINSNTWVSKIIEGGLPQLLAGPAGNALSRLLGAVVDIPAAYLHGFAQSAKDKTEAKSYISQQISKRVAEMAVEDSQIMDRALNNMLSRSYRSQNNKDAIAALSIEDLRENPPSNDSKGPSEDWMMKFERYAEDASSDDLRLMFSKLLSSEIRNPGRVSPATLHFSSMLDSQTAQFIDRALSVYADDGLSLIECLNPELSITEISHIEQSGFWSPEKIYTMTFGSNGMSIARVGTEGFGVAFKSTPGSSISIKSAILSKSGNELAAIVKKEFDLNSLVEAISKKGTISEVFYGKVNEIEGRRLNMSNPTRIK